MKKPDQKLINAAMEEIGKYISLPENYMTTPQMVKDFFRLRLATKEREVFSVLFLDQRHGVIHCEDMFMGTINASNVYIREIIKKSLEVNAGAIILAHNHPSGNCIPSGPDKNITKRIVEVCSIMDIRVLDHIVVGAFECYSFSEKGLM